MKFNELSDMMQKPEPKPDTYEAGMALNQLLKIGTHAIKIHNMIDDGAEMESWVAKKIDLASNYVKSVHGYTAGSKVGTYDDDGMSEMKRMPKGTGTMQGVKENPLMALGVAAASGAGNAIGNRIADKLGAGKKANTNMIKKEDTPATDKEIKMAKGIAFDKRNKDNMSKATSTIEKVRKGLSQQPDVADALRTANEDAGEGHMSKSQLYATAKMAIELLDMINKGDDLEGWVQTKLNLAADYLQAVYHYEDYQKLNPYREELDGALVQRHAGIIQKHLDEILERKCRAEDVDTKPGMMRILKKRVNEVEKEMAKENRKSTDEGDGRKKGIHGKGHPMRQKQQAAIHANEESYIKPYISMYKGKDGKQVYDVLDKHEKSAYKTSDERLAQHFFKKNYDKLREAELDEGIKEWGKRLAMAGVIVAGLAGANSINNAIDNSIPAVKAMNTALELAQDSGNTELAKMIEKDLSDAKVRLSSGKDLSHVADMQDKYAKFMKTEGMAYESKLAVNLKQRLK